MKTNIMICFIFLFSCQDKPLMKITHSNTPIELYVSERDYSRVTDFYIKEEIFEEFVRLFPFRNFYCDEKFSIESNYRDTIVLNGKNSSFSIKKGFSEYLKGPHKPFREDYYSILSDSLHHEFAKLFPEIEDDYLLKVPVEVPITYDSIYIDPYYNCD